MLSLALASTQGLLIPHAKHGVNAAPTARGRVQAFFLSDETSRNPKAILEDEATCHLLTDSQKVRARRVLAPVYSICPANVPRRVPLVR
jgi:hypothetical protein